MLVDQLPVLSDPNGEDEIPIERGTNLYKVKLRNLPSNSIVVDPDLDKDSTNPVQNKVATRHIEEIEKTLSELRPYDPLPKTYDQTQPVGRDEEGKLFTAPVSDLKVDAAVARWLETHTISGVVFTVSGKRLILTPMD